MLTSAAVLFFLEVPEKLLWIQLMEDTKLENRKTIIRKLCAHNWPLNACKAAILL